MREFLPKKRPEPEIINSWVSALARGELTMSELAKKLDCEESVAQSLVDDVYREAAKAVLTWSAGQSKR